MRSHRTRPFWLRRESACVKRVKPLRFAEKSGQYDAFFKNFSDGMTAAAAAH
jgi:hypothetical protein